MRRSSLATWALACGTLGGCAPSEAGASPVDGVLVLEVGGEQSSLRQALVAAGVDVAPAVRREATPIDAGASAPPAESPAESPPPGPQPEPGVAADHVVVELGRGETLMQLAKKHLGSSNRYHEILERNGWTEADARRLRPGQLVKVPKDRSAPGR